MQGKLVQGSLASIPWNNDTFDLVYSHEVSEHIPAGLQRVDIAPDSYLARAHVIRPDT